jgi:hypothetical protein
MNVSFVCQTQFSEELRMVEPKARHQGSLLEIVEGACVKEARRGPGYLVAKIFWQRPVLVWFLAIPGEITLMSIRPDLT